MHTVKKIIGDDAQRIMKNIGTVDAEIIQAYIEIQTEKKVYGLRLFDNALVGVLITSAVVGVAGLLVLICIGLNDSTKLSNYGIRVVSAETRIKQVEENIQILEDQNVLIQKVKTMCVEFENDFQ